MAHAIDIPFECWPVIVTGSSGGKKRLMLSGQANPNGNDEGPLASIADGHRGTRTYEANYRPCTVIYISKGCWPDSGIHEGLD